MSATKTELVQTFGRKKNSIAVAAVKKGKGVMRVNGSPIDLLEPAGLRMKVWEPIVLLGVARFQNLDIRVKVRGGGYTSQLYAIRQAIAKGIVAYYQKYVDESQKREVKGTIALLCRIVVEVRQESPRCRSKKVRAKEIRWTRCQSSCPEVLQMIDI